MKHKWILFAVLILAAHTVLAGCSKKAPPAPVKPYVVEIPEDLPVLKQNLPPELPENHWQRRPVETGEVSNDFEEPSAEEKAMIAPAGD